MSAETRDARRPARDGGALRARGARRAAGRQPAAVRRRPRRSSSPSSSSSSPESRSTATRLADYCRVCGFTLRDALPATYPHVLAFPLQMRLMADGAFPFPLLGLVHLDNAITQHRPIARGRAARPAGPRRRPATPPEGQGLLAARRGTRRRRARLGGARHDPPTRRRRPGGDAATRGPRPFPRTPPPSPSGASAAISAAATRASPATATRSTCIRSAPRPSASRARSPTGCGARPAASPSSRAGSPTRFSVEVRFQKPLLLPGRVGFVPVERDGGRIGFALRTSATAPSTYPASCGPFHSLHGSGHRAPRG